MRYACQRARFGGLSPFLRQSVLRILAANPAIRGHNINLAQGGATVGELLLQAKEAVSLKPKPGLVLIQIMDDDVGCGSGVCDFLDHSGRWFQAGSRTSRT